MTFTYSYRDKNGAKREAVIEAASRAAAFAALKAQGISPLSVRAGGGRAGAPRTPQSGGRMSPRAAVCALAAVFVLVVAGGLWWWMRQGNQKPADGENQKSHRIVQREGKAKDGKIQLPPASEPSRPKSITPSSAEIRQASHDVVAAPEKEGRVVTNTALGAITYLSPDDPDIAIKTGIHQEIGSLMSGELGDPVAPFPYSFQVEGSGSQTDEFVASLKHKVELRAGDDIPTMELKRKTLQARLDLLAAIDEGLSVKDALKEAYIQRVRAYEARQAYIADLKGYAAENPPQKEFNDTLEAVNAKLKEKGIKIISRENLGLEDEDE